MQIDRLDLLALAAILAIGIGAYLFFFNRTAATLPLPCALGPCAMSSTPHDNAACFAKLAFSGKNASICMDSAGPDECAGTMAHLSGQNTTCATWSDPQACAYFDALAPLRDGTATKIDAEKTCISLRPDYRKDQCFFEYALSLGDTSLCGRILRQDLQSGCIIQLGGSG